MFNLIAFLITCVGGINWFCIGLFQFDVIAGIFGSQAHFVSRFFYVIIGLASIYSLIALPIKKGKIYEPKKKEDDMGLEEKEDEDTEEKPKQKQASKSKKSAKSDSKMTESKASKSKSGSKTKNKTSTKTSPKKKSTTISIEKSTEVE